MYIYSFKNNSSFKQASNRQTKSTKRFSTYQEYVIKKTIFDHPTITDNILNVVVWYNSNVKVANKTMFYKSWYKNGVKVVQAFLDEDCNILVFDVF